MICTLFTMLKLRLFKYSVCLCYSFKRVTFICSFTLANRPGVKRVGCSVYSVLGYMNWRICLPDFFLVSEFESSWDRGPLCKDSVPFHSCTSVQEAKEQPSGKKKICQTEHSAPLLGFLTIVTESERGREVGCLLWSHAQLLFREARDVYILETVDKDNHESSAIISSLCLF